MALAESYGKRAGALREEQAKLQRELKDVKGRVRKIGKEGKRSCNFRHSHRDQLHRRCPALSVLLPRMRPDSWILGDWRMKRERPTFYTQSCKEKTDPVKRKRKGAVAASHTLKERMAHLSSVNAILWELSKILALLLYTCVVWAKKWAPEAAEPAFKPASCPSAGVFSHMGALEGHNLEPLCAVLLALVGVRVSVAGATHEGLHTHL